MNTNTRTCGPAPADHFFVSSCDGSLNDTRPRDTGPGMVLVRETYRQRFDRIDTVSQFKATLRCGPGAAYTYAFLCADGAPLCFACARGNFRLIVGAIRDSDNDQWRVVGQVIADEPPCVCAHCGRDICGGH